MARTPKVPGMEPIPVRGEEEAWRLLEALAAADFDTEGQLPIITGWPDFHFRFWVDERGIALTAPIMQAMIDYQTSINRAFMLVLENTTELTGLSEEERQRFELAFKAQRGSTDLSVNAQDAINKFMELAIGRFTGKQLTVMILAFALLYAGYASWAAYLENQREIAKTEASRQQSRDLLDAQRFAGRAEIERMKLLRDALVRTSGSPALIEASRDGKRGVVRAAAKVRNTEVAGVNLPPEVAKRMARNARTQPRTGEVIGEYEVIRVDADVDDGFRVRLRETKSGELIFASVRDRLVSEQDRALIQRGEWEKKPIVVRLSERRRGSGTLVSARVEEVLRVVGDPEIASND